MLGADNIFAFSYKDHIRINSFCYTRSDVVHLLHPLHLVGSFELFGDTFFFGVFFYEPRKELLCLFFDVCEVRVELAES